MNSTDDLIVITLSDIQLLFRRHLSKIKWIVAIAGLVCFSLLLLRQPRYEAEATFKQGSKSSEIGLSLKETYQQLFSPPSEGATAAIMLSNEVLKGTIEALGMQADCSHGPKIVRALRRIRDNFLLELGRPLSELDPFLFSDVSYTDEKPLNLFLELTETKKYRVFDQNKKQLVEAPLGKPVAFSSTRLTLQKAPLNAKIGKLYPLSLQPLPNIVAVVRKKMKVGPIRQDKSILKLEFFSRDRHLAADFINDLMKSYQAYLKRENDETCQVQLAYLRQRQQELTEYYDEALVDHVGYLKDNLDKNGFIVMAQEMEVLSKPKSLYTSRLFDIDLELRRLPPECRIAKGMNLSGEYNKNEYQPYFDEKNQLEKRLDSCDLDHKRNALMSPSLLVEIKDVGEQVNEATRLLDCLGQQEQIPTLPSLLKNPKSAIALLIKQIAESSTFSDRSLAIPLVEEIIGQLVQKRKILEENLDLQKQEVNDFSGIQLETAQELLVVYTRDRDNLQAQLRELVFLRDQIFYPEFEISSLGGVLNDNITVDLIQKAGAVALLLNDSNNRSEREQSRLQETLQTQKNFLSQYLLQTIELKKLKARLLNDKIDSLLRTTGCLLESEKALITDKLQELHQKMGNLPDKWRRESLLAIRKELGSTVLQAVSQIAETKNLNQHIFHANSKPLDAATPSLKALPPKLFLFSLFAALAAGLTYYAFIFCKNLLKGFPVTFENLKVSGFPICGSFSKQCDANLHMLSSKDLETMRRIIEFLMSQPKKTEALVAVCMGGKYPKYTLSLAELLSMRGLKVLAIDCVFDQVVHTDETPGLWQYLHQPTQALPLKHLLMFDHLPSGGTTRHAAELVGSAKFTNFLSRIKQKYDLLLLFSSADAMSAEGHAFLPLCDSVIVTTQQEKKDELLVYVDWANKKGTSCATFIYADEFC